MAVLAKLESRPVRSYNEMEFMKKIVLIYGLPGSGKTTIARMLYARLEGSAIWFNADKVRATLSKDLGFDEASRQEQARRMGCLASLALDGSQAEYSIVDFVNPTVQTYRTFVENTRRPAGNKLDDSHRVPDAFLNEVGYPIFSVFMNTISHSRYADTNKIFESRDHVRRPDVIIERYLESNLDFEKAVTYIYQSLLSHNPEPKKVSP